MMRMHHLQGTGEPAALTAGPKWQSRGEVSIVFVAAVLCLEQQDDLRRQVGNAVGHGQDDLLIGAADAEVTAADPGPCLVRLAVDIDPPEPACPVPSPCLMPQPVRRAVQWPYPPVTCH